MLLGVPGGGLAASSAVLGAQLPGFVREPGGRAQRE